jgi:hypothetical protein
MLAEQQAYNGQFKDSISKRENKVITKQSQALSIV